MPEGGGSGKGIIGSGGDKYKDKGGNPTQPHMPTPLTGPRHTTVSAVHFYYTSTSHRVGINLGKFPINSSTTFDNINTFTDITGDGNTFTIDWSNANQFDLYYENSPVSNQTFARWRKYKATYASGWEEEFDLLIPGTSQAVPFTGSSPTGWVLSGIAWPCRAIATWPDFMFQGYLQMGTYVWPSNPQYRYTQTNIISDPSSVYYNGSTYLLAPTNSNPLEVMAYTSANDNFHLTNAAGGGGTGYIALPDPGQAAPQKIAALSILVDSTSKQHTEFLNTTLGFPWSQVETGLRSGLLSNIDWDLPFIYVVDYTENLPTCSTTTYTINGCLDENNMAYWGYDADGDGILEDCDGVVIPAAVQLNPNLATWIPGDCCPDCINSAGDDIIYSTQPLTLSVQGTNPSTYGATDGYIDVTIVDQGFDSAGVPLGLPTGTANYTYVLQNQNAADTMLNQAAGKSVSSGAVSKTSFTFGYLVPGSNANGGLLQTGATGTTAITTSDPQGYVPGGSDVTATTISSEGLRDGTYNVYVFDSSETICLGQATIRLDEPGQTTGCTDNNALNTSDPLANITDNSNCHYCEATNGNLVKTNGTNVGSGSIVASAVAIGTASATDSNNTDGEILLTSFSPTATFQAYINDIVSGSTSTQNADYKIELYRWDDQSSTGNSTWSSTYPYNFLTPFNAGTTQVGSAITTAGTGWNTTINTANLGAGITYGRYSIKLYVSDPDDTVEVEQCYEIFDLKVKVRACIDNGVATTIDNVIVPLDLAQNDPTICTSLNSFCCDSALLIPYPGFDPCSAFYYESHITCTPDTDDATYTLQFQNGASWIDVTTPVTLLGVSGNYSTSSYAFGLSEFQINGNGEYRVAWTSTYSNSADCTIYSNIASITLPIVGCIEPAATNYNSLATCPDNCIYCVYGCTDPLADNYNPTATCDDGSCVFPVYGCTDPTATNFDPLATTDDGSCVYPPCGCTDPLAINYNSTVTCDDGSCIYCDNPPLTYTYTATNATIIAGTCTSNLDGCINLTVASNSCTTTWTLVDCFFFCGISNSNISLVTSTDYSYGVVANICNLAGGHTYTLNLEDCNGCLMQIDIFVGTDSTDCGCTDSNATNYDPTATIDDGSCQFCGCTDDTAVNYNPAATSNCIPDTCIYPNLTPPCIPPHIDQVFDKLKLCISENGFSYHNKLSIGLVDDCSIMNVWKLMLVDYLLGKVGLDCIYNCADANTPNASDVHTSCNDIWVTGGPNTGLNDAAVSGTGVGTTSTVAMFYTSGTLSPGDIIKHHNSDNIWIFDGPVQVGTPTPVSVVGLDPENATGNLSGYWRYCNDSLRYINTNNINYIDKFINFANTFCRDCDNNLYKFNSNPSKSNAASGPASSLRSLGIDGIDGIDI